MILLEVCAAIGGAIGFLVAITARRATLATWLLALWVVLVLIAFAHVVELMVHATST